MEGVSVHLWTLERVVLAKYLYKYVGFIWQVGIDWFCDCTLKIKKKFPFQSLIVAAGFQAGMVITVIT